jgi:hypothetical protein
MNYDRALTYVKKGNLLSYADTDKVRGENRNANENALIQYYGAEREIHLIARIRYERSNSCNGRKNKLLCSIKCPVNPIPVKGEFELPSENALHQFLKANGWELKNEVNSWILK